MSRGDFWSRRRAAVEAEQAAEAEARARATEEAEAAKVAEKTDEEILAEYDLPDPDALKLGDDISGFMNKAVPERLRRRALRRLWRLNPVLANLDGLNDYDDDFTAAATDAPGVKTAYRVGKGLLKHIEALEAENTPAADTAEPQTAKAEPTEKSQENDRSATEPTTKVVMAEAALETETDDDYSVVAVPRRMQFRFEDDS
ncbi:DUF3306 domain-containing protein [Aestuariicoccus sp. MJ-SS9]|uniref:DUF3306 domain-containing protein n=1 Tax=Aestuariicoccus sp. MJ-SS9 TaxID=3079855 RepID=UPI00290A71A8|nr:DUF3306 domain-containing protein [Aestuariicoccus sp. MJ-SS9]MDU8912437.1 DUF3306 domain-containing protein [Aestuariicoccus sp. MJ-SS9]